MDLLVDGGVGCSYLCWVDEELDTYHGRRPLRCGIIRLRVALYFDVQGVFTTRDFTCGARRLVASVL